MPWPASFAIGRVLYGSCGLPEEISLRTAAQPLQRASPLLGLDAFPDDGRTYRRPISRMACTTCWLTFFFVDVAHQAHVDLQVARAQVRDRLQPRVARPTSSMAKREAEIEERVHGLAVEVQVLDDLALRDLGGDGWKGARPER